MFREGHNAAWLRNVTYVSATVLVVGFATLLLLYAVQDGIIFRPDFQGMRQPDDNPHPFQNPGQFGLRYDDVWLKADDGASLHGWFIHAPPHGGTNKSPTVLFFHGNAGNMGMRLENVFGLVNKCKVNVFIISYPGYGYSDGRPSENGFYLAGKAALDHLLEREDVDSQNIFVFGRSIGGAVAIDLATKNNDNKNIAGVVVENTFSCIKDMATVVIPFLRFVSFAIGPFQKIRFDSASKISSLQTPIMFISGTEDRLVPPPQMRVLETALPKTTRRTFLTIPGGGHDDLWRVGGNMYYEEIAKFINSRKESDHKRL